ncbi:MAG: hypothetical protein ACXU82_03695 [Caulobacteraceae bacterium]
MQTGRPDHDALIRSSAIPDEEPIFILRAKDSLAGGAVRAWASAAYFSHVVPIAVVEQALKQADRMDEWSARKIPSGDHLAEAERKQLEYEFDRRAWRARDDSGDPKIMLAEERAFRAMLGRLRPVLRELFERGSWKDGSFTYTPSDEVIMAASDHFCAVSALAHLRTTLTAGEIQEAVGG